MGTQEMATAWGSGTPSVKSIHTAEKQGCHKELDAGHLHPVHLGGEVINHHDMHGETHRAQGGPEKSPHSKRREPLIHRRYRPKMAITTLIHSLAPLFLPEKRPRIGTITMYRAVINAGLPHRGVLDAHLLQAREPNPGPGRRRCRLGATSSDWPSPAGGVPEFCGAEKSG